MTTEGNKFKITAVRTGIHSPAKGRITTVDQFVNVVHFAVPGMEGIFNFFIIVGKDILQNAHGIIMAEKGKKVNPLKFPS